MAFERGEVIVMQLMLHEYEAKSNAMFERYGVKTILDTPKLVFLDQRRDKSDNRQIPYKGEIRTDSLVRFLAGLSPPLARLGGAGDKDEL